MQPGSSDPPSRPGPPDGARPPNGDSPPRGADPLDGQGCPGDEPLNGLREDRLSESEALEVEDHLRRCPRCRRRARALEDRAREAKDAEEARRAERDAARLHHGPGARRRKVIDMLVGGALAAAVAAGAYSLLPKRPSPEDAVRVDGAALLRVQVERDQSWVDAPAGESLAPDESVRLTFHGTQAGYLTLLTIDPNGEVAAAYPSTASAASWTPGEGPLPAIRLDDVPGPHAFVAILCPQPIAVSTVQSSLAKAASTPERFALLTCTLDMVRVGVRPRSPSQ